MRFFVHDITVGQETVPLRCYIPDVCGKTSYEGRRPAVIIFPGGAYCMTYHGEAEPIALQYVAEGICAFVLDYSCKPIHFPYQQLEAFAAIRYVREHAEEFGIAKNNIATSGFSAAPATLKWNSVCSITCFSWLSCALSRYGSICCMTSEINFCFMAFLLQS